ncbi:MAG: hypothetical protein WCI52_02840 [bacterium]
MAESKFTISRGETGGSKQITFYYCSKVNFAELREIVAKEFPGVPETSLNVFPGIVSCVITDGKSLEVPTT